MPLRCLLFVFRGPPSVELVLLWCFFCAWAVFFLCCFCDSPGAKCVGLLQVFTDSLCANGQEKVGLVTWQSPFLCFCGDIFVTFRCSFYGRAVLVLCFFCGRPGAEFMILWCFPCACLVILGNIDCVLLFKILCVNFHYADFFFSLGFRP